MANVLRDPEFVAACLNGVQVFSYYASPNKTQGEFNNFLQRLEDKVRLIAPGIPILVTGDFNTRSTAWGDRVTNKRGDDLSTLFESLELIIANIGSILTFFRGAGSIVDVTAMSEPLVQRVSGWRMLDNEFNNSDHHYVRFSMDALSRLEPPLNANSTKPAGWDTSRGIDIDMLHTGFLLADW